MRYFIHAVPERIWYINNFLIPSMLSQGIQVDELEMYVDNGNDGNLVSCLNSLSMMPNDDKGTWHIQDDIMISHNFAEITRQANNSVMCGMCMDIDEEQEKPDGKVDAENMWYSFQCIYIPNRLALQFVHWFNTVAIDDPKYALWISKNKYDDSFFRRFMLENNLGYDIINIKPNIVNHIDYMLDGSLINKDLDDINRQAKYFEDRDLQISLELKIKTYRLTQKMKESTNKLNTTNNIDDILDKYTMTRKRKRNLPLEMNYNGYSEK